MHFLKLEEEEEPALIVEMPFEEGCLRGRTKSCRVLANK